MRHSPRQPPNGLTDPVAGRPASRTLTKNSPFHRARPKWMATIDKTTPPAAFGLAALLSGINPKNLLLAAVGAAAIAATGIPGGQQAIAYLVFAVIATLGVGIPVVIYFAVGKRSGKVLAGLKDWMTANNAVIMTVISLIIAAKLIGDAISSLTG